MTGKRAIGQIIAAAAATAVVLAPGLLAAEDTSGLIADICSAEHRPPPNAGPRQIVLLSGVGSGGFPITTRSAQAQTWFDYGVKLYHAFYHQDAIAAFKRSEELDPTCAMCAWGEAWSRGPTLNFEVGKDEIAASLALARKAESLATNATPREKALIAAMIDRYSDPQTGAELRFVKALDALSSGEAKDDQVADIAAHSWMLIARRGDKTGPLNAMADLEPVLARSPNDTAAIHYYIHATEYAHVSAKALPYAERLAGLAPQASHLVHMAAHTYFDVGMYPDASAVNARALGVDGVHATAMNASGDLGSIRYYGHNLGFGLASAMMDGDKALALKFADHTAVAYPDDKGDNEGSMAGRAEMAYGRYAPDYALTTPDPGSIKPTRRIFWHYGRGEAFASKGDLKGLDAEVAALAGPGWPAGVSRGVLEGHAAMLRNDPHAAARAYEAAAQMQEKQLAGNMDPPPWWYPVRRSVAAADLKAGDFEAAAKEARTSLAAWPQDPLALLVLSRAETGLKQTAQAQADMAAARKQWRGDLTKVSIDLI